MLQSEIPYNQHLMLVLIKEIKDCPKEKFGLFLAQAKSENAQEQLKEALGEDVFSQLIANLQLRYGYEDDEEVAPIGSIHEGKDDNSNKD